MKVIIASALVFALGCKSSSNNIKSFIPGTYIKSINTEYSNGMDTLIVEMISDAGNNYRIKRHSGYQRIRDGKILARETKSEEWIAIYSENEKVLHEIKYGKIISFDPTNSGLYVGSARYTKLED